MNNKTRKRRLPGKHKGKQKVKLGWQVAQPQSLPENLPVVLRENPGSAMKRNGRWDKPVWPGDFGWGNKWGGGSQRGFQGLKQIENKNGKLMDSWKDKEKRSEKKNRIYNKFCIFHLSVCVCERSSTRYVHCKLL